MLEVMEKYGWDWYTYHSQPVWVTNLIKQKLGIEAKLTANAAENLKNAHGQQ